MIIRRIPSSPEHSEARNEDFWLGEGHPTAKAHRIVAEKLVEDLGMLAESGE